MAEGPCDTERKREKGGNGREQLVMATLLSPSPHVSERREGETRRQLDRFGRRGDGNRGEVSSLPGLGSSAASGLCGDDGVVDGAREVTPQPEVGSPAVAGACSDGGSSLECRGLSSGDEEFIRVVTPLIWDMVPRAL
jgi:hypothetical protein